jgi:hypothetical protein
MAATSPSSPPSSAQPEQSSSNGAHDGAAQNHSGGTQISGLDGCSHQTCACCHPTPCWSSFLHAWLSRALAPRCRFPRPALLRLARIQSAQQLPASGLHIYRHKNQPLTQCQRHRQLRWANSLGARWQVQTLGSFRQTRFGSSTKRNMAFTIPLANADTESLERFFILLGRGPEDCHRDLCGRPLGLAHH